MPRITQKQTLLLDADDTLWENNIYFERAIAQFISYLDHRKHSREEVRECLNECEALNIQAIGYGLRSFSQSLVDCFEALSEAPIHDAAHASILKFAHEISVQEIELLPGVETTLNELAARHHLILVTKGHPLEQTDKLRRSGLERLFQFVEVLPEKDAAAYCLIQRKHSLTPELVWMIGNSPKSDINPALAAGLHAVFVPHAQTWILEHTDLHQPKAPQQLIQVEKFADLANFF
jgi:putative hydrolase of the HAD superfamily